MDALADAVDRCLDPVWRLASTGFTTTVKSLPSYVAGVNDPDEAVALTRTIIAAVLVPERRKAIDAEPHLLAAALTEARQHLLDRAADNGRVVSIAAEHEANQVPEGTPDIDAVIEQDRTPADPPAHHFRRDSDTETLNACQTTLELLDDRSQQLLELRWREGKTAREVATVFTCGPAAVSAHERRVRRKVRRALIKKFPARNFGAASVDRLLSEHIGRASLPAITRERLRSDILKRTFQSEPAPYRVRLGWGIAAAAVAFGLWLLMFFRVLPYYDDDVYPSPTVEVNCEGACTPGNEARIGVLAPSDARFVALFISDASGTSRPWLTAPGGGVLSLPFGARERVVPLPYAATWPADIAGEAGVTAIFTGDRVSPKTLSEIGAGDRGGVMTSSTTVRVGS